MRGRFYAWDGDVLILNVLGTPSAKRDAIGKIHGSELKVRVSADPKGGRATESMLAFLAGEFGVARSEVELVSGRTSPHKRVRIRGPKKLPAAIVRPPNSPG